MDHSLYAALIGATPIAFASVEALLLIGAIVVAAGAVIAGVIAFRASRREPPHEEGVRHAPSPSSLGMADDPIVAALVGTSGDRQSRRPRKPDRSEP